MARITLDQIKTEADKHQWRVITPEYKNLKTEMEFICSGGHTIHSTYENIRNKWECQYCLRENLQQLKNYSNKIPPKHKNQKRILALDQATHATGFAIYDNISLVKSGIFHTKEGLTESRINEIDHWFRDMVGMIRPELVGIEDIQLQVVKGKAIGVTVYKTLAQLQGVLINACYELGVECMVVPPSTWRAKSNITGQSRETKKQAAVYRVKQYFDLDVKDDEADAILLGYYLATYGGVSPVKIENWEV